ncbi:MAG: hypothetical protein KGL39_49100 [Patescibacteria group bacterium]|nr:hypothetical protein [Patescibacteria group bacterium]
MKGFRTPEELTRRIIKRAYGKEWVRLREVCRVLKAWERLRSIEPARGTLHSSFTYVSEPGRNRISLPPPWNIAHLTDVRVAPAVDWWIETFDGTRYHPAMFRERSAHLLFKDTGAFNVGFYETVSGRTYTITLFESKDGKECRICHPQQGQLSKEEAHMRYRLWGVYSHEHYEAIGLAHDDRRAIDQYYEIRQGGE